jgi:hypothetical protein
MRSSAAMRPPSSTRTRSARLIASSTSWVTISTAGAWAPQRFRTRSCILMRVRASSDANGSSRRRSRGSRTSARASAARCASPPESVPGQASIRWDSPTSAKAASARRRASPPERPSATFRQTRFHGRRRGSWNTTARADGTATSWPSAASRPARVRRSVVLPEPLRPRSATNSPCAISRSRPSSTVVAPKRRVKVWTRTAGVLWD